MTERLTIHCDKVPDDILDVEVIDGLVYFETYQAEPEGELPCITLNRESATKLRDALTDWLEGQP